MLFSNQDGGIFDWVGVKRERSAALGPRFYDGLVKALDLITCSYLKNYNQLCRPLTIMQRALCLIRPAHHGTSSLKDRLKKRCSLQFNLKLKCGLINLFNIVYAHIARVIIHQTPNAIGLFCKAAKFSCLSAIAG